MGSQRVPEAASRSVSGLAQAVAACPHTLPQTTLVLIDGPGGSGKTTLAARLSRALATDSEVRGAAPGMRASAAGDGASVQVLHADDMYEGWNGLPDLDGVLVDQVLAPLAQGRPGRFRRWDWHRGARAEEIVARPGGVLIIEGVGVALRGARAHAGLVVWIEADAELRRRRALERDGAAMQSAWEGWRTLESAFLAQQGTRAAADLIIDGSRPLPD